MKILGSSSAEQKKALRTFSSCCYQAHCFVAEESNFHSLFYSPSPQVEQTLSSLLPLSLVLEETMLQAWDNRLIKKLQQKYPINISQSITVAQCKHHNWGLFGPVWNTRVSDLIAGVWRGKVAGWAWRVLKAPAPGEEALVQAPKPSR